MKKVFVAVALLVSLAAGQAQVNDFLITLSGAQENPANSSPGFGSGTATIGPGNVVTYNISYSGLTGTAVSGAHIHGPAAIGANAGVLFPFNSSILAPAGGTISTSFTYSASQISDLRAGLHYANIHTTPSFAGGEIRGQVLPVPEPSIMAITALGASMLAWRFRRRS